MTRQNFDRFDIDESLLYLSFRYVAPSLWKAGQIRCSVIHPQLLCCHIRCRFFHIF